jgi:hypothetical protein
MALFLWAENRLAQMENMDFFPPLSSSMAHRQIPATTGDEMGARCCRVGSLDQGGPIEGGLTVRHSPQ